MSVFRPTYKEKNTGETKQSKTWRYKFIFAGKEINESAKTASKTVAKEAEKKRRRELELGFNAITDARDRRVRTVAELADDFLTDYKIRQPKSAVFAEYCLRRMKRILGETMAVDVNDKTVRQYQNARLKEKAAPKSINEEVNFLLRLLPIAQAGAIRAVLKQQKALKLKVGKGPGKAFSESEKTQLVEAAKKAPRSKGIALAMLLAQQAGLRDKEVRELQWERFDLVGRVITVGETKTDAGSGRRIPMSDEIYAAALEYSKWYIGKFGATKPAWYLFPFGINKENGDPSRPQSTLKTAWKRAREHAKVTGRYHDNRHTFVTDLAESGAGDEVIRGHGGARLERDAEAL